MNLTGRGSGSTYFSDIESFSLTIDNSRFHDMNSKQQVEPQLKSYLKDWKET